MNRMMPPSAAITSLSTAFSRSSNSPRYFAPAISAPMSSASSFLSFRDSGTSPLTMRKREAFDDRGLADAGLADQHRIVLGPARQHLDRAADLLVAADDRIELAGARGLGQVARIFLQRVIGVFGARRIRPCGPCADPRSPALSVCAVTPASARILPASAPFSIASASKQPLDGDEGIARLLRDLLGVVEQPRGGRREIELAGARALHLGQFGEREFDLRERVARAPARLVDQPGREPLLVVEEHLEQMLGRELLMAFADRERLRALDEAPARSVYFSKFMRCLPWPPAAPRSDAAGSERSDLPPCAACLLFKRARRPRKRGGGEFAEGRAPADARARLRRRDPARRTLFRLSRRRRSAPRLD